MSEPVRIRPIRPGDAADWERMRRTFWSAEAGEHAREIAAFFGGNRYNPAEVLLAIDSLGRTVGFAELSVRSHAEGCRSGPIAYLEAWYVEEAMRGKGIGAALIEAAEQWGRAQSCTELASDTELANQDGAAAHRSTGFTEVERIICFRKSL